MSTGTWKGEWCNRSRRKSFKWRIESQITPVSIKQALSPERQPLSLTAKSLVWFCVNVHFFLFMMSVCLSHQHLCVMNLRISLIFGLFGVRVYPLCVLATAVKSPHSQDPGLFWIYVQWINICVWGLFDRAYSSWNNVKCLLDETR